MRCMLPAALAVAALAFWAPTAAAQHQACPAGVTVAEVAQVLPGQVAWDQAAGTEDLTRVLAFAPQEVGACTVTINASKWRLLLPQEQCTVMVHELGHSVMGLDHINDGRNIMNAEIIDDFPWCNRLIANEPATRLQRLRAKMARYERAHRKHLRLSIHRPHRLRAAR